MAGDLNTPPPAPTPAEWRAAMGFFPTGVTVVTTWRDSLPVGSTVNAFCSVSLEPPLLLICLDWANPICGPVQSCGVFGVNILGEDGSLLARNFAVEPEANRFERCGFRGGPDGAPRLEQAPVFIDCAVESTVPAGDHLIVIGRGLRTELTGMSPPLLYQRGSFLKLPAVR